jgi:pimeloyl-ACP methyl ester carboxylesterase
MSFASPARCAGWIAALLLCAAAVFGDARARAQQQRPQPAGTPQQRQEGKPEPKPEDKKEPKIETRFVPAADGVRIAYDISGTGPALVLLHGNGQSRKDWHDAGYVKELAARFTVIPIDLRGAGESDKPSKTEAYAIDRIVADVLAVADAVRAERFHLWGYSNGAIIGRYVAARSDRVQSMVYVGVPFGPAVSPLMKEAITGMRAKWQPVIDAADSGTLDLSKLSPGDRDSWERGRMRVAVASLGAMLEYPAVEPGELRCPTLWLMGTNDPEALESAKAYEPKLKDTQVTLVRLEGLNHGEEFFKVQQVLSRAVEFTLAPAKPSK